MSVKFRVGDRCIVTEGPLTGEEVLIHDVFEYADIPNEYLVSRLSPGPVRSNRLVTLDETGLVLAR